MNLEDKLSQVKQMHTPPKQLKSEDCSSLASLLAGALARMGVQINKTSDLSRMLSALEWLGSFPADAPQPDTAYEQNHKRAVDSFILFEQASRLASAITLAVHIPGSSSIVRRLGKRLDRMRTQDEPAQDFFFELDIAQRLYRRGFQVAFEEPDIVLHLEDLTVAIACKRPRKLERLCQRIVEASAQIIRSQLPGFIVVGLEALFHKSGDPQKPTVVYDVEQQSDLDLCAEPILGKAIQIAQPVIDRAFAKGVWGVLFCGLITGISRQPSANIFSWIRRPISNPKVSGAAEVLDLQIFGTHEELDELLRRLRLANGLTE